MNFNDYAKEWDNDYRIERAKRIANAIEKAVDFSKVGSVMEFGCGTGLISFNLLDRLNQNCKVVDLIDSSEGMIEIVKNKISLLNAFTLRGIVIDLVNESWTSTYDLIYTSMALHHITDLDGILKKLTSLLNSDGTLCIVDLNEEDGSFHEHDHSFEGHHGFNQESLKELLANLGYRDIESNTFYYGLKGSGNNKVAYSLFLLKATKI